VSGWQIAAVVAVVWCVLSAVLAVAWAKRWIRVEPPGGWADEEREF
jgi:hypothetical protein